MKTFKSIFALLIGFSLSVMAYGSTHYEENSDTIKIRTNKDTEIIIVLDNLSDLKNIGKEINTVMKSLDTVFNRIDAIDTVINVTVNKIENKIFIDGKTGSDGKTMEINIDSPKKPYVEKNLHGFTSFSLGLNNYLENGIFPNDNKEQYSVKAWGSWDISLGAGLRWYVAKPLSFDIAADVNWFNFKYQDRATRIDMSNNNIEFIGDANGYTYTKSKLTVPYINASIIPMAHFGKKSKGLNRNMFRLGAGVYAGYRIGGKVKYAFEDNNTRTVYKDRDDFYLSSYRYGAKAVFGIEDFNIYASYDLNTLFAKNKAPELNPISFGLNFIF